MGELKTVDRSDPLFESYLTGAFSKDHRALPVQTLNVSSDSEQVTFHVVPLHEIKTPSFFVKWAVVFKLGNLLYVLAPLFLIAFKNSGPWTVPWVGALAAFGVVLLHFSFNLRNDYWDHMTGVDRLLPQAGGRAIRNGWVTAKSTLTWSNIYLALGVVAGLPALWMYPPVLWITLSALVFGAFGFFNFRKALKYRLWTEFYLFFLYGPLLTLGFQASLGADFDLESAIIGVLTGAFTVFMLQLKFFENFVIHSQASFQNSLVSLGFEKGQKFLMVMAFLFSVFLACYHLGFHDVWMFGFFAILACLVGLWNVRYWKDLKSPMGSELKKVTASLRWSVLGLYMVWILKTAIFGML